jgi:hypothetical protein
LYAKRKPTNRSLLLKHHPKTEGRPFAAICLDESLLAVQHDD